MPITVQGAARPKLNLPPLRAIDGGKTVDAAELDRFTRAIAEWGVKVDQWNNDQDGTITTLQTQVTGLQTQVAELQAVAPGSWSKLVRSAAAGSTTSATFVNWPTTAPLTMTFNKRYADTNLLIDLRASFFTGTVNVPQKVGVLIDGVDFLVIDSFLNVASSHDSRSGGLTVTGLTAGLHTFIMRASSDGAATLQGDGNDNNTLIVTEVPVGP